MLEQLFRFSRFETNLIDIHVRPCSFGMTICIWPLQENLQDAIFHQTSEILFGACSFQAGSCPVLPSLERVGSLVPSPGPSKSFFPGYQFGYQQTRVFLGWAPSRGLNSFSYRPSEASPAGRLKSDPKGIRSPMTRNFDID